ncbi:hypothetical protein C8R45DRAFT_1154670 [Mycena sanguinolenta]|nr:hypothetical protein C8R45DRAFT_1154670 [Mycena sanguinolenta]
MSSTSTFEISAPGFVAGACTAIVWLLFREFIKHAVATAVSALIYLFGQTPLCLMAVSTTFLAVFLNFWRLIVLHELARYFLATVVLLLDEEAEDTVEEAHSTLGGYIVTPEITDEEDIRESQAISAFVAGAFPVFMWLFCKEDLKAGFTIAATILFYAQPFFLTHATILASVLNLMRLMVLFEAARYLLTTATLLLDEPDTEEEVDFIPGAYIFTPEATDQQEPSDPPIIDCSTSDQTLVHEGESGSQVVKLISASNSTQDVAPLVHEVVPESIPSSDLLNVPSTNTVPAGIPGTALRKSKNTKRVASKLFSSVRRISGPFSPQTPFLAAVKSSSLFGC